LDCEHDAAALTRGLSDVPGLTEVKVRLKSAKVILSFEPARTSAQRLQEKLESLGFPALQGRDMVAPPKLWRNPQVLASAASGVLLLVGWLIAVAGGPEPASLVIYTSAVFVGGHYFGREAVEELIFARRIGIELLMSVAAVAALILGQAAQAAMLVFLYSISEALEGYTEARTRSAIQALMDLTPKRALVRRDGREVEIAAEEIQVGDVFLVKPGQAVPTDGEVIHGQSSVNQAPVTGESLPVEKAVNDTVFAGSINGEGSLEVRATKSFAENTISRIIEMVEEAQEKKGKSQRFIERFGARYSPVVLLIGVLIAIAPPLFSGAWASWVIRATVFIVAAAPCALVISVPITSVASLGTGARNGVLIKGGVHLEELAKVKVVALDKTGTITCGEPDVTDVLYPIEDAVTSRSKSDVLAVAAGIERLSQHPLAMAIVRHAEAQGVAPADMQDFRSLTGAGASARFNDSMVYIGKSDFFQKELQLDLEPVKGMIERLQGDGKTVVLIGDEQDVWGLIAIRDNVRPNVRPAIDGLRAMGVKAVVMLTGDNECTARAIARQIGIDEYYADLTPEDKVSKVRELAQRHGHVVMVGDGVNDAPALAEASIGVAMGAAGTDVALETADVALMADDLEKLVYALQLARRNRAIVSQNLVLSAIVIATLVVGAVWGFCSLPMAVLGHEISELLVIGNGLRMLQT